MSYISMIAPIASKLLDFIFPPITNQFGYLFHYNKNVKNIRELLEKLQDKRSRVEGGYVAKRNGELIESDVERWLTEVGEIVEKLGKFLEDDAIGEKRSCFNVCCLHLCSSYKLSKEAKKEDPIVAALLQDGDFGGGVSHPAPHPGIAPTAFKTFESRMPVMEEIMEVLKKDEFRMIGIHGIGGVGKTTIAKEVFARAKKDELFEEVVMAVVSQAPKIREIQGQIADLLDLKFSEETEAGRAGRLHARLNGKRVLVILDDV
ncbi:probable disease resistance protein At1g61190, partial [Camellia sinensis]|uniref:probable disease resistance protein At1g61190 n=1 Tax=Camellia sinensis TaxID=4442 RepID=UPI00103629F4